MTPMTAYSIVTEQPLCWSDAPFRTGREGPRGDRRRAALRLTATADTAFPPPVKGRGSCQHGIRRNKQKNPRQMHAPREGSADGADRAAYRLLALRKTADRKDMNPL